MYRDALKQMDEQKSRKIEELNKRVVDLTQTLRSQVYMYAYIWKRRNTRREEHQEAHRPPIHTPNPQEDAARSAERERMAAMSGSSG